MAQAPVVTAVVGTAGHVDHGKSALIQALTGMDPMRLSEERKRGMTIEIGFAHLQLPGAGTVGFIDVPGHEGLIRTMIAGASGIDCVLLVVAADDGAMPQTREHLAICQYLGVRRGMIVVTKADLIDAELLPLLEEDLRELTQGTFLTDAPVIHTSAKTGLGLDDLRAALTELVAGAQAPDAAGPVYLAIQRVFSLSGHGTVITGVPASGTVRVGDELRLADRDLPLAVRGLHVHGVPVTEGRAGHRLALNVKGVSPTEVERGQVVATPGFFAPASTLIVSVRLAPNTLPAEDGAEALVHVGTAERLGTLRLIGARRLVPGEEGLAQIQLNQPVCVPLGAPLILRRTSPPLVWGGGRVIDRETLRIRHRLAPESAAPFVALADALGEPETRVAALIRARGAHGVEKKSLPARTDLLPGICRAAIAELVETGAVIEDPKRSLVLDIRVWQALVGTVPEAVAEYHRAHPEEVGPSGAHIAHVVGCPAPLGNRLIGQCIDAGTLKELDRRVFMPEPPPLSGDHAALFEQVLARLTEDGLAAPVLNNLVAELGIDAKALGPVLAYGVRTARLVEVAPGHYMVRPEVERARQVLLSGLATQEMISVVTFRELLPEISNRAAKALLDHFDKDPRIERRGNFRYLADPAPDDPTK